MKLKTSVLLRALAVAESVHHYQKLIKCLVKRPVRPQAQICPQRRSLKKKCTLYHLPVRLKRE